MLLTDDQKMLQETAASFLTDEGRPAQQLRHWRDTGCSDGFGTELWRQFGELGLTAICIPESQGGLGLGATEAALVLEEIGRNLTPSPFLMSAVVAARAIEGTAHGERWYPHILGGEAVLALAVDEGPRHDPETIALEARRHGNGFVLNGSKQFVVQGASADMIVAAARTENGLTLFAVPKGAAEVENVTLVDGSKAARMRFDDVALDADAVIGEVDGGWVPLSRAAFELSTSVALSTSSPDVPFGTANSVSPSVSPGAPPVRASVSTMSAELPCTTNCLYPLRTKPLPCRFASSAVCSGA